MNVSCAFASRRIRRWPAWLLFGILLGLPCLPDVRAEPALIFGLLPSESVATKFRRYAPLRDYLQQRLGRAVVLETARDFRAFRRRTLAGRYDFLETAPHFVPEAVDSGHYRVITTIIRRLTAEIVVHADSPLRQPEDLAGATVATPSPSAVITRLGKETLIAAGLTGDRVPRYRVFPTHNAAYAAVVGKAVQGALISVNVFDKALRQGQPLRSIGHSRAIPNMSILVARRLGSALSAKLQRVLIRMNVDPTGRRILQKMAYPGYRKAVEEEFESLRPYRQPLAP